jgi:hypothetical protein
VSLFRNKLFSIGLQLKSLSFQERERERERKETLSPMNTSCATGLVRRALITKLAMRSREEFLFEDETTATWQLDPFG